MLSWVEHEKGFISMGADPESTLYQIYLEEIDIGLFSLENVHVIRKILDLVSDRNMYL